MDANFKTYFQIRSYLMARKDQEKKIGVEEGLREKERKREEWKSRKEEEEGGEGREVIPLDLE